MGAIAGNVTKSPDGLFSHIGLGAAKQLDKDGNSASLDDDLSLSGRARGDVGESPGGFELHQSVRGSQELDEAANDASLDDLLDGRVALLGQKLSELGGGLDLEVDLVGEDARNHLRKILVKLINVMLADPYTSCKFWHVFPRAQCNWAHPVFRLQRACKTAHAQLSRQSVRMPATKMWGSVIFPPHHKQKHSIIAKPAR